MTSRRTANGGSADEDPPRVTVVCVPRDHHGDVEESLEALLDRTDVAHELVYVLGRAPKDAAEYVRRRSSEVGFTLIEQDSYLVPSHARNLARAHVSTEYVVFIDNDAVVGSGWLGPLIDCADETGAAVVGPLQFIEPLEHEQIHLAGGFIEMDETKSPRVIHRTHRFQGLRPEEVAASMRREECDFAEFHCMLVRTAALDTAGPFDERFLSVREVEDFAMIVRTTGGTVWFEPESHVTFLPLREVRGADIGYVARRWGERAVRTSFEHFCAKHDLDRSHIPRSGSFSTDQRRFIFARVRRPIQRPFDWLGVGKVESAAAHVVFRVERLLNWLFIRPGPTTF